MLRLLKVVTSGTAAVTALILSMAFAPAASAQKCQNAQSNPKQVSTHAAQDAVLCLLNNQRTRHGLHRLRPNNELHDAARNHTGYMRRHSCFEHQCAGEASISGRLYAVHYLKNGLRTWRYGENIAYGVRRWASPKALVKAWMHSPPHRENILNPDFRDLGIGIAWGTPSNSHAKGAIYTTDFGLRRG